MGGNKAPPPHINTIKKKKTPPFKEYNSMNWELWGSRMSLVSRIRLAPWSECKIRTEFVFFLRATCLKVLESPIVSPIATRKTLCHAIWNTYWTSSLIVEGMPAIGILMMRPINDLVFVRVRLKCTCIIDLCILGRTLHHKITHDGTHETITCWWCSDWKSAGVIGVRGGKCPDGR